MISVRELQRVGLSVWKAEKTEKGEDGGRAEKGVGDNH